MIAARTSHPPTAGDPGMWLCALLAVALHGALLFAWKTAPQESAAATIEGDSVEVALVESAPAAVAEPQPPAPAIVPPTPAVVPPEPDPVPPPEPPKKEPEMILPQPPKPTPPPRALRMATPLPRTAPQPATARGTPSPRAAAGTTGGASAPAGTSASGTGTGKNAKATYVVRPVAAYPPESRTAGEQGVVILRLTVDGGGRPTAVNVAKSSGFPHLDRAAVEAGWRCRVRDAAAGSHLEAPVRFNLSEKP